MGITIDNCYVPNRNIGGIRVGGYILLWVIIAIAAFAADIITSAFIFVWFSLGAIVSIIASILGADIVVQIAIFIVSSAIFTLIGYPIAKKTIKDTVKKTLTTEQGYIGREFVLDTDINEKGNIKFDGIYWTFINEGEPIKKGDRVIITGIDGNKLIIKKI